MSIYLQALAAAQAAQQTREDENAARVAAWFAAHPECRHPIVRIDDSGRIWRDKTREIEIENQHGAGWLVARRISIKKNVGVVKTKNLITLGVQAKIAEVIHPNLRWAAVLGFEGAYEVSETGIVRTTTGRILSQSHDRHGHLRVTLAMGGGKRVLHVSRVVWMAFRGETDRVIIHKNGNKRDNRLVNLAESDKRNRMKYDIEESRAILAAVRQWGGLSDEDGMPTMQSARKNDFQKRQSRVILPRV